MSQPDNYTELEVKLYVPDLNTIRERLEAANATLVFARVHEQNLRYDNSKGDLAGNGYVLRLRQDSIARITYKEPKDPAAEAKGIHARYEAEVTVSDFEATDTILKKLGFTVFMTYEKYRTTYHFNGCEVVLDEMPYGNFVEIEADNEAAIDQIIAQLELDDAPRIVHSYAELFENIKAALNLTFRDLTFDNFDGIDIPQSVLNKSS
ncbi:MAG: class IV adenylate cyclase [Chloroflexota bacterium]